jgi:hypothetical protein
MLKSLNKLTGWQRSWFVVIAIYSMLICFWTIRYMLNDETTFMVKAKQEGILFLLWIIPSVLLYIIGRTVDRYIRELKTRN